MKKILVLILIISFNCNSQNNKEIIKEFIDIVLSDESRDINKYDNVLDTNIKIIVNKNKDSISSKMFYTKISYLKAEIKKNKNKYEILNYREFKSTPIFKDYKILYSNKEQIFCIVINERFITPIIIENKKIISFFTSLIKHKERINPLFFE